MNKTAQNITHMLLLPFDNERKASRIDPDSEKPDWARIWPFIFLHVACLGVFWTGYSQTALYAAAASYLVRMFAITGFYHRYFSHKTFKTSRSIQFLFAVLGTAATQRGPLWWAGHHRLHHRHSDTEKDMHTPEKGFWQSHCGWFLSGKAFRTPNERIMDFSKYPELVWLNRYDMIIPVLYATGFFLLGTLLEHFYPETQTNGWQMLVWGYFISTTVLIHATLSINSLAHRFGSRRYATKDLSRNNFWLALITLGEGWHNNHHHYQGSTRQGFFFWEVDITFYLLKLMSWCGLVSELRAVPEHKRLARQETVAPHVMATGSQSNRRSQA